jgi:hypothetical protein
VHHEFGVSLFEEGTSAFWYVQAWGWQIAVNFVDGCGKPFP